MQLTVYNRFQKRHITIAAKKCVTCNEVRPKEVFQDNPLRPDGLSAQCRSCLNKAKDGTWKKDRTDQPVPTTASQCDSKQADLALARELKEVWE